METTTTMLKLLFGGVFRCVVVRGLWGWLQGLWEWLLREAGDPMAMLTEG